MKKSTIKKEKASLKARRTKTNVLKNAKGITLVALVTTIIIIIILSTVAISFAFGDNGLIKRAEIAKDMTEESRKEEDNIIQDYEDMIISAVGVDWETALKNATKHPEQIISTAIGVGTDGKPVNMDLWEFTLLNDGTYVLNDSETINGGTKTSGYSNDNIVDGKIKGKIPQYIKDKGNDTFIPVTSLSNTFRSVTSLKYAPVVPSTVNDMEETFIHCSELTEMPEIPYGVKDMTSSFYNCSKLTDVTNISDTVEIMNYTFQNCSQIITSPKLPKNLIKMSHCFLNCSKLVEMPAIPDNVTLMNGTFWGCTEIIEMKRIPEKVERMGDCFRDCVKLTTATAIPDSVSDMRSAFRGCSNLQGVIEINANLTGAIIDSGYTDYYHCFDEATTNVGITLQLTGDCEILDKIIEDANNPNIHL